MHFYVNISESMWTLSQLEILYYELFIFNIHIHIFFSWFLYPPLRYGSIAGINYYIFQRHFKHTECTARKESRAMKNILKKTAMGSLQLMQYTKDPTWKNCWIQNKLSHISQVCIYKGLAGMFKKKFKKIHKHHQ